MNAQNSLDQLEVLKTELTKKNISIDEFQELVKDLQTSMQVDQTTEDLVAQAKLHDEITTLISIGALVMSYAPI